MSEMPRIVLFGSTGRVGKRLMVTLAAAGYDVTGIDRARCDFTTATPKDIAVIIRAVEPVAVINASAYTAVDKAEGEEALAMRINAEIPGMIAASAAEIGVPLIHCSTDYVFDGLRSQPNTEADTTNPLSAYGRSKLAGEQAVRTHRAHVFRLQWIFEGRGKNFFMTMARILATQPEARVVADQLGAPSHAQHIAQAITDALPAICSGTLPPAIYHLAAAGYTSWHGFACAIAQATSSAATIRAIVATEYPLPAARPKDARLSTAALAAHGIAMPHWREGVALAAKEYHAHP